MSAIKKLQISVNDDDLEAEYLFDSAKDMDVDDCVIVEAVTAAKDAFCARLNKSIKET